MDDRLCLLLVIIGTDESGRKEVLAMMDRYIESTPSWEEVLFDLSQRWLSIAPHLAFGDGALGVCNSLAKVWPSTAQQHFWVHKTANVLDKLTKAMQLKVKDVLHNIYLAETRESAYQVFDHCIEKYTVKYLKAMNFLKKDKDVTIDHYDFPAKHWSHIIATNPIE